METKAKSRCKGDRELKAATLRTQLPSSFSDGEVFVAALRPGDVQREIVGEPCSAFAGVCRD